MKLDLSKKRIIIFATIVLAVVLIVVLAVVAFGGKSDDVNGPASSIPFQDHDEFNKSSEMTSSDKDELEDLWTYGIVDYSLMNLLITKAVRLWSAVLLKMALLVKTLLMQLRLIATLRMTARLMQRFPLKKMAIYKSILKPRPFGRGFL